MRLGLGSQSVQINSGRSWRLLDALGVFWRVLEASGGSWRLLDGLLEATGGSWRLLAPRASRSSNLDSQGVQIQFWRLLEAPGGAIGGSWRLLEAPGRFWRVSGNSWRGYWRFLEAARASEGFWRLLEASGGAIGGSWRILETPGGSWRLLEAPGSSQAGGPLQAPVGRQRNYFSPTYPQQVILRAIYSPSTSSETLLFIYIYIYIKLKNFALRGSAPHGVGGSPQGLNPEPKDL